LSCSSSDETCASYRSVWLMLPQVIYLPKLAHWHFPVPMLDYQECWVIRFWTIALLLWCTFSIGYVNK